MAARGAAAAAAVATATLALLRIRPCAALADRLSRRTLYSSAPSRSAPPPHAAAPADAPAPADAAAPRRRAAELRARLDAALRVADTPALAAAAAAAEAAAGDVGLWDDRAAAEATLRRGAALREELAELEALRAAAADLDLCLELLALEEADAAASGGAGGAAAAAAAAEARAGADALAAALAEWELRRLLGGPHDAADATLTVSAGAGGTDAQDWAVMLERMYLRWAEARGFSARVVDRAPGEEAGIKSVEIEVRGRGHAYGRLAGERGAHRLVRQSPFNAKAARQTSFAAVEVTPILPDALADGLVVPDSELEITTMRSSGAGGQNVNKLETCVRVRHLPTGLAVRCQEQRSQAANKEAALRRLKARLLVRAQEAAEAAAAAARGEPVRAEWGQQVRSYVLHPYTMVKDARTRHETGDAAKVLDGGLDGFIAAYLEWKGGGGMSGGGGGGGGAGE
jgi:peptide chain release factor 2